MTERDKLQVGDWVMHEIYGVGRVEALSPEQMTLRLGQLDRSIAPWGSWANFAADQLGVWEWNGKREFASLIPCRWRGHYCCYSHVVDVEWVEDFSDPLIPMECQVCGVRIAPHTVEDLLTNPLICPFDLPDS